MSKEIYRKRELDTLKFLAILLVYTTHFIACYKPELFNSIWYSFPTSLFMQGITGKLGVAIFGVLLGYFAYNSGTRKPFVEYTIKRYGYFVWAGLFINILIILLEQGSILNAVVISFKLSDAIYPTIWFFRDFLIASIVANYLGRNKARIPTCIVFIVVFVILKQEWIAICLLGTIVEKLLDSKVFKNKLISLVILIALFILIKRQENTITYYLDGLFSLVLIIVIENSKYIKKAFSNKLTSTLGEKTMAILVIHVLVYEKLGSFLFANYFATNGIDVVMVWLICLAVICLISFPITYLFNLYNVLFEKISNKIKGEVRTYE